MSLNGLDSADIQEAYGAAITEAGGWFLLKYTSRDSVELLGRGKGGVHEARIAIAKYEDLSPLYGLIIYRRRKVLIKFIPDGTSRLLQARTAVHFSDVTDRFQPFETLLEITTAEGLNDTSLASSFPLHTASPSASQSRLHEISEDGEDGAPTPRSRPANYSSIPSATGAIFGTQRYKLEKRVDQLMGPDRPTKRSERPTPSIQITGEPTSPLVSPISSPLASPQRSSLSQLPMRQDSGKASSNPFTSLPSVPSVTEYADSDVSGHSGESGVSIDENVQEKKLPQIPQQTETETEPELTEQPPQPPPKTSMDHEAGRPSTATTDVSVETQKAIDPPAERHLENGHTEQRSVERPSISDRPSISERPKWDTDEPYDFSYLEPKPKVKLGPRPVAAGDRTKRSAMATVSAVPASVRPVQKQESVVRPKSQGPMNISVPKNLPEPPPIPDMPTYNPRPLSRGSIKSLPSHRSSAMTPDKIRLMKAVELRKKQLRKSQGPEQRSELPKRDEEVPAIPQKSEARQRLMRVQSIEQAAPQRLPDEQKSQKADSGIEMGYEKAEREQQAQQSDAAQVSAAEQQPTDDTPKQMPRKVSQESLKLDTHSPPSQQQHTGASWQEHMTGLLPPADLSSAPLASSRAHNDEDIPSAISPAESLPSVVVTERPSSSREQQATPKQQSQKLTEEAMDSSADDTDNSALDIPHSPRRQNSDLARRRRGFVEPLQINVSAVTTPGTDGEHFLSDDDLMEELQSATVQEAQPVSMSRTPTTQHFARRPSGQSQGSAEDGHSVKSVQITQRKSSQALERQSSESTRDSPEMSHITPKMKPPQVYQPTSPETQDPMQGLKRHISTGITQRIQRLADISSRDTSREGSPIRDRSISPETTRDYFSQRSSYRSGMRPRNSSYRTSKRMSNKASPSSEKVSPIETTPSWTVHHDGPGSRNSVSVTARIVRNQLNKQQSGQPAESQFQHSDLVINHKRTSSQQSGTLPTITTRDSAVLHTDKPLPTLSPNFTRMSTEGPRQMHSASRSSMGRHKEPSADDFPPPPSGAMRATSPVSHFSDDAPIAKEASRASRFFKRMSTFGGNKRKSTAQASAGTSSKPSSVVDTPTATHRPVLADKSDMPPPVVVGDLNVQFPDNLLWKRRWVEIDDAGFMIFSIPQAMEHQRGVAKKYHMNEFRMPYAPDLDRQELPHSIMLDGVDGTTLQAACEDGMTHRQVLHILRQYHKSWVGN